MNAAIASDADRILAARRAAELVHRAMLRRHAERVDLLLAAGAKPADLPPVWYHFPDSVGGIASECPDCAPDRA